MRRWWDNPRIPLSTVSRLRFAWVTLILSVVGWPLSAFTFAAQEPQAILALSWLAVAYTAWDIISTSDVHAEVLDGDGEGQA
jgi:hypothetical protein